MVFELFRKQKGVPNFAALFLILPQKCSPRGTAAFRKLGCKGLATLDTIVSVI